MTEPSGLELHRRLAASLDSPAETVVLRPTLAGTRPRTKSGAHPAGASALRPVRQAHATQPGNGTQLPRQRMELLLLFSDTQRVVTEVDGKQQQYLAKHANGYRCHSNKGVPFPARS
ncbi:hypothetical protein NOK12_00280 [Nocardioides sp. OK12]|nr:hypothetical protein NOK12_00280 [Nocardioides sp. OK12]